MTSIFFQAGQLLSKILTITILLLFQFYARLYAESRSPLQLPATPRQPVIQLSANFQQKLFYPGQQAMLVIKGELPPDSYIYSIHPQIPNGPLPSQVKVLSAVLKPLKNLTESTTSQVYDETYGTILNVHKNFFYFRRLYQILPYAKPGKHYMKGRLLYQMCSQRLCSFPQEQRFIIHFEILAPQQ